MEANVNINLLNAVNALKAKEGTKGEIMKRNNFLVKGIALSALTAALALSFSLVLSGCGSKSPEKIAAEIEKLQEELEKTQSAGDAEIAETNSGTASGGIKGFIQRHPIVARYIIPCLAGIIIGLAVAFLGRIIIVWLKDDNSGLFSGILEPVGWIISVALGVAGITTIIVAGFILKKLPLGFSISYLVSNVVFGMKFFIDVIEEENAAASGCFITSAVCRSFAKPDDCYELSLFRQFRDGWLTEQPEGPALIEQYYRSAPGIVAAIDRSPAPDAVYRRIWDEHLAPCLRAIENGQLEDCKGRYISMVETLGAEYLQ
jgi:hypothetical protein